MDHVRNIQAWLRTTDLAGMVLPSTDEFLSEFAPPAERRLLWAMGFGGSTGLGIVLRDSAALFLDGRYLAQATADLTGLNLEILPATPCARRDWLGSKLQMRSRLGFDPCLHSVAEMSQWLSLAADIDLDVVLLPENPIEQLWTEARPPAHRPQIVDYPVCYAGQDYLTKCAGLAEYLRDTRAYTFLVADPEDVSWLLNVRASEHAIRTGVGEWHIVPSCPSRALVHSDDRVTWFVDRELLSAELLGREPSITIADPNTLPDILRTVAGQGPVAFDQRRTPAALGHIIQELDGARFDDAVARRRWCKHEVEVEAARKAHIIDAVAVVRFMVWLLRAAQERSVDEFEAAERLAALRAENPNYRGPSMPLMSASGRSGAQPHYVPTRERSRCINEHPIYWMDSGGQYFGGTTDNTLTLAVGRPEPKHVLAHTLVLQGYIAVASARLPQGTHAHRVDTFARQALWREGMDFAHGTGHGVGNYLNIHEGPQITREPNPMSAVPLEVGMIVTNEPGYYAAGDFGLRIESHMVVVTSSFPGFVEFDTISRLPIDPRLVDFDRLSRHERRWLAKYHTTVLRDLAPLLDGSAASWLRGIVGVFISADELA